jgi:hypothetical protein
MPRSAAVVGLGLAFAGCHDATDHEKERVIGRIDPVHTTVPVIVAPVEATVNAPFMVIVHTVGSSDCTKPDRDEVSEQSDLVRIVPYDIVPIAGHSDVCQDDYTFHEHRIRLTREREGPVRLRVVGLTAASRVDRLDSVEVGLPVRP